MNSVIKTSKIIVIENVPMLPIQLADLCHHHYCGSVVGL